MTKWFEDPISPFRYRMDVALVLQKIPRVRKAMTSVRSEQMERNDRDIDWNTFIRIQRDDNVLIFRTIFSSSVGEIEDGSLKWLSDDSIQSKIRVWKMTRASHRELEFWHVRKIVQRERPINEWTRMSARLPIILEDNAFSMYSSRDSPLDNPVISTCTTYHSRRSFLQRAQIFLRSQYSHVCDHIVFAESHRHLSWANCTTLRTEYRTSERASLRVNDESSSLRTIIRRRNRNNIAKLFFRRIMEKKKKIFKWEEKISISVGFTSSRRSYFSS